jgi:non-specific protein-tyrosine kinase
VLGALAGLVGGIGLAFLLERLDTRLHSPEQAEQVLGSSLLGTIPNAGRSASNVFLGGSSPAQEAYRYLGARITALARKDGLRSILVTSEGRNEGKSTVVANLASAIAQSGQRVVAVDANLRRPSLHQMLDVPNRTGLSNILEGELALPEADQYSGSSGVWVIPTGPARSAPAALVASQQMHNVIQKLCEQFDLVLIDAPAILSVADAALLAPMVDGVVLVVRRDHAHKEAVRSAVKQLADVGATVLGVVFNSGQPAGRQRGASYPVRVDKSRGAAPRQPIAAPKPISPQLKVPAPTDTNRTRELTNTSKPGTDGSSGE